jgi:hypothetical protein
LVPTWATAGFVLALLFTEIEDFGEVPFATAITAGLAKTPTTGVLLAAETAFGPAVAAFIAGLAAAAFTETALAAGAADALLLPVEIVAFELDTAGLAEACTEAAFAFESAGFTETAFWVEVAGLAVDVALTEAAAFVFGVTLAALAFAPFGDGLPACVLLVAGCTLTVAGAAGFCTAVGACANAAADRSMSVPRVRII